MTDPRTVLRETLAHQLLITRQARDALWADYWQRRRVVVVPDEMIATRPHEFAEGTARNGLCAVCGCEYDTVRTGDGPSYRLHPMGNGSPVGPTTYLRSNEEIIRDCITRLKAAREKDSTNRNLSTLLAVVVKVQRDLEALLNGEA